MAGCDGVSGSAHVNVRARLAGLTLIIVVLCTLAYSLVGSGILWPILGLVCVGVHLIVHGIAGRDNLMLPRWVVILLAVSCATRHTAAWTRSVVSPHSCLKCGRPGRKRESYITR